LTNVPFSRLREYCCRSKINLNIVRGAHASVYGSSSNRPFELAAMECCIVSNPYLGLEEWFEPGKELFIVQEADEIGELYQWLLDNETERKKIGQRARERVLKEHTYQHRAKLLVQMIRDLLG
jgi:spore maturation protein CgeB